MAFNEDLEKLKSTWGELSFPWKIILATMLLAQAMSIASIGESLHKFKGFIVHGIDFYRSLTEPLLYAFKYIGMPLIDRGLVDSFVWILLVLGVGYRASKIVADRSFFPVLVAGLIFGLVITLVVEKGNLREIESTGVLVGALGLIGYNSFVIKSWVPLGFFVFPFILVSVIAAISQGLAGA